MRLEEIRKIYFIGIGGIGMSALARYFHSRNIEVHGYDKTETALTRELAEEGMKIHYEDSVEFIPEGVDLVVFTPAVPAGHSELLYFRQNDYPILKRAAVLGIISRGMKTMAVAGTHGKTTTSTLLAHILRVGGIDCTAFLGGIAGNYGTNYLEGKSEWVVVEADEYDRSFLQLHPDIAIINSVDPDHLDIFGDTEKMLEAYVQFIDQIKNGGLLVIKEGLPLNLKEKKPAVKTFGIEKGQYRATGVHVKDGWVIFDLAGENHAIKGLRFGMPGFHNIENAVAAATAALQIGVTTGAVKEALETFKGVGRRFEIIWRDDETVFINDYAHHPEALRSVIQAARMMYSGKKITGVFQPHLYTRTRDFGDEFAKSLDLLDEALLLEIYPAREEPIEGINSDMILGKMKLANKGLTTKEKLVETLKERKLEVLMILGAGDIDDVKEPVKEMLQSRK